MEKLYYSVPSALELPDSGKTSWQSPSNIALIKYWGKHDVQLPKNPSVSFTLKNSYTQTTLLFEKNNSEEFNFEVFQEGVRELSFEPKIHDFFERIEKYIPFLSKYKYRIETSNSFPHSSGIASSASGLSALSLCLMDIERSINPTMSDKFFFEKASFLSRLGSGSACRSIEGPIVVWGKHNKIENSSDLIGIKYPFSVHEIFEDYQDTILLVDKGKKQVSSTIGHNLMDGHPFAEQRFKQAQGHLSKMINVLESGNLQEFVRIVESEALSLHAMMLTSNPHFILMKPNTLEIINKIWEYRKKANSFLCFTLDAGANVHLLYPKIEKRLVLQFIHKDLKRYCENNSYIIDETSNGAFKIGV